MEREEIDINIFDILKALKKRWIMIAEIVLVCTIISVAYSFFIADPIYDTTTKVFIGKQVSQNSGQYDVNEVSMFQKLMETYAGFAKSSDLIDKAMSDNNIDLTSDEVLKNFSVTTGEQDQFLTFKYSSKKIDEGVKVLEAITEEFIETTSTHIPNGTVAVIESPKYPTKPSSPNKPKNIVIAILFGLIVGVGSTLLLEYLDNTVNSKDEIEKLLGVPVIGVVPEANGEEVTNTKTVKADKSRRRGEYSA